MCSTPSEAEQVGHLLDDHLHMQRLENLWEGEGNKRDRVNERSKARSDPETIFVIIELFQYLDFLDRIFWIRQFFYKGSRAFHH